MDYFLCVDEYPAKLLPAWLLTPSMYMRRTYIEFVGLDKPFKEISLSLENLKRFEGEIFKRQT